MKSCDRSCDVLPGFPPSELALAANENIECFVCEFMQFYVISENCQRKDARLFKQLHSLGAGGGTGIVGLNSRGCSRLRKAQQPAVPLTSSRGSSSELQSDRQTSCGEYQIYALITDRVQ